jgi:hypothetical protein
MSSNLSDSQQKAILTTVALSDMAQGLQRVVPAAKEFAETLTVGKLALGGIVAAIATAGVAISAHIDHTGMLNEVNRTAADTSYYLADGLNFVGQKIPGVGNALGWLKGKTDDWSKSAHGMVTASDEAAAAQSRLMAQLINTGNAAAYSNAQVAAARAGQSAYGPYKTGYKFDENNPGYQDLVYTANMAPPKVSAPKSVGGSVRSAANDAAQAAKEAAAKLKSAQKTVADAVRGLVESFAPKLDMSNSATGYSRIGDTHGGGKSGLIANLKKQADDTLKLRQDLEKLAKMGLDKGLLSQLVAGGLDSLPAAEDLLKGGKAEIGQANYYAGRINVRSNTIAAEETARDLTKADKKELHINVSGGDADLVKLVRKWVRNNGGNVQSVLGSN